MLASMAIAVDGSWLGSVSPGAVVEQTVHLADRAPRSGATRVPRRAGVGTRPAVSARIDRFEPRFFLPTALSAKPTA
jgi:hypothetical protein